MDDGMFDIQFTPEAKDDLKPLRKQDQTFVVRSIESQLTYEPNVAMRNANGCGPTRLLTGSCAPASFGILQRR
jgi:hypothetical protein